MVGDIEAMNIEEYLAQHSVHRSVEVKEFPPYARGFILACVLLGMLIFPLDVRGLILWVAILFVPIITKRNKYYILENGFAVKEKNKVVVIPLDKIDTIERRVYTEKTRDVYFVIQILSFAAVALIVVLNFLFGDISLLVNMQTLVLLVGLIILGVLARYFSKSSLGTIFVRPAQVPYATIRVKSVKAIDYAVKLISLVIIINAVILTITSLGIDLDSVLGDFLSIIKLANDYLMLPFETLFSYISFMLNPTIGSIVYDPTVLDLIDRLLFLWVIGILAYFLSRNIIPLAIPIIGTGYMGMMVYAPEISPFIPPIINVLMLPLLTAVLVYLFYFLLGTSISLYYGNVLRKRIAVLSYSITPEIKSFFETLHTKIVLNRVNETETVEKNLKVKKSLSIGYKILALYTAIILFYETLPLGILAGDTNSYFLLVTVLLLIGFVFFALRSLSQTLLIKLYNYKPGMSAVLWRNGFTLKNFITGKKFSYEDTRSYNLVNIVYVNAQRSLSLKYLALGLFSLIIATVFSPIPIPGYLTIPILGYWTVNLWIILFILLFISIPSLTMKGPISSLNIVTVSGNYGLVLPIVSSPTIYDSEFVKRFIKHLAKT